MVGGGGVDDIFSGGIMDVRIQSAKEVQLSQALEDIRAGKIDKVEVYADRLALFYKDNKDEPMTSRKEGNVSLQKYWTGCRLNRTR